MGKKDVMTAVPALSNFSTNSKYKFKVTAATQTPDFS